MGQREPQIILKTEERDICLELGREGKFGPKISWLGVKTGFPRGNKLEVAVNNGRWVLTRLPAGRGRSSSRYGTISIPSR